MNERCHPLSLHFCIFPLGPCYHSDAETLEMTPQVNVVSRDKAVQMLSNMKSSSSEIIPFNGDQGYSHETCFVGDRSFVLLVTINSGFLPLLFNWAESLKRLGLQCEGVLVIEDDDVIGHLRRYPLPMFKVLGKQIVGNQSHSEIKKQFKGQYSYLNLINRRLSYLLTLLESGSDVLLADVDTVWLKNPLRLIRDSYDHFDVWLARGILEMPCPCFMFVKSNHRTINLINRWSEKLSTTKRKLTDQQALYLVLKKVTPDLRIQKFSLKQFPTGREFFNATWHSANKDTVYVAHANHLGRQERKIRKLKEFKLWFAPD